MKMVVYYNILRFDGEGFRKVAETNTQTKAEAMVELYTKRYARKGYTYTFIVCYG